METKKLTAQEIVPASRRLGRDDAIKLASAAKKITVAKGKKADKVQSTSIPSKKVVKPTAKAVKKPTTKVVKEVVAQPKVVETKSPFSFAKASVNSKAVREALVSLALASDNEKQSILEALPLNVALTIIDLTK